MEYHEWLRQLKVWDEVVVESGHLGKARFEKDRICFIFSDGWIRVGLKLYSSMSGLSSLGDSKLLDPNDNETITILKECDKIRFIGAVTGSMRNIKYDSMTYDQAVKIAKIMGWEV